MHISFANGGTNTLIAKVSGELDHHIAGKIRDEADARIIKDNIKKLIFDFSELNFMDSSGIGLVIGRYKLVRNCGGKVNIVSCNPCINKILHMSGIMRIIDVYPDIKYVKEII